MKKALLLIFAAATLFACKKEHIVSKGYTGTFELRARYGGLAGISEKYDPGNGNIVQFNTDSTFKSYTGGKLTNQGAFSIRKGPQTTTDRIYFNDDPQYGQDIVLNKDTLTIGTSVTDNIAVVYVRVK